MSLKVATTFALIGSALSGLLSALFLVDSPEIARILYSGGINVAALVHVFSSVCMIIFFATLLSKQK
jgi:hypothetical protein